MIHITGVPHIGSNITNCIAQAIYICGRTQGITPGAVFDVDLPYDRNSFYEISAVGELDDDGVDLTFKFNDVQVTVKGDSDPDLIYRDWSRALDGYIDKTVGPYPKPVLSNKEKKNDARIEAENERGRQERQAAFEAELRASTGTLDAKLEAAPAIELADETTWNEYVAKNSDGGYNEAVIRFAEKWARLMQSELAQGKPLEEIADSTSYEVGHVEGITGFQYGCAVGLLSQCWKHGEQLRRWHNLKTQLRDEGEKANDEGGVLNPALVRISGS